MNKRCKHVLSAAFLLPFYLLTTDALAQPVDLTVQNPGWTFDVVPYVWLLNMNGRVGVGSTTAHVDQNFNDILDKMNFGGMLALEANKDRFGIFVNALYADLSDTVSDGPFSIDATNHYGLISGGVSYRVYQYCFGSSFGGNTQKIDIEPYAGFRYTLNDTKVKLNTPLFSLSDSNNQNWTDPILGARVRLAMSNAWSFTFAGDVGGTNHSSDYSYNAMGLIGYSPQSFWTNTTAYVGYRVLYQHYNTGSGANRYEWNMKLFGPMLGLAISF